MFVLTLGIVLLCVDKRMVVYSLQDKHIGFYMNIISNDSP